jgi:GNAT superfamily N-acetyltransferase
VIFETHELSDGTRVRLRLARPTDIARVQAFLEGSPEWIVRYFTYYDLRERLMLAAVTLADGVEQIVGLADVSFRGGGLAEVGVLVREDARGQRLGTLLLETAASLAAQRGATRLKGERPMMPLLERLGRTVRTVEDGRAVAYTRLERSPRRRRSAA